VGAETGGGKPPLDGNAGDDGPFGNRFLLVSVACKRVTQLQGGARRRVDAGRHKPCLVAVAEVMAGTVPYFVS
jgi:DNA-directed RNA polymerase subunit K/omega